MKNVYFLSDAHLGSWALEHRRMQERRLVRFLDNIKTKAAAVYLLGDMFDFWYEYKFVVPKGYTRFLGKLSELTDMGIEVHYFTGNHDIWAYSYFESLGMERMEQPAVVQIAGKTFCLGHGDGLGPGMRGYKVMRGIFHNRFLQRAFSSLHPWLAFRLGNGWSRQSRLAKDKPYDFRGEAEPLYQWCADFASRQHVDWFIFGHYHTQADLTLPGGARLLLLPDWMEKSPYFLFDGLSVLTFLT